MSWSMIATGILGVLLLVAGYQVHAQPDAPVPPPPQLTLQEAHCRSLNNMVFYITYARSYGLPRDQTRLHVSAQIDALNLNENSKLTILSSMDQTLEKIYNRPGDAFVHLAFIRGHEAGCIQRVHRRLHAPTPPTLTPTALHCLFMANIVFYTTHARSHGLPIEQAKLHVVSKIDAQNWDQDTKIRSLSNLERALERIYAFPRENFDHFRDFVRGYEAGCNARFKKE